MNIDASVDVIRRRIEYKHALVDWCFRHQHRCMARGKIDDALTWINTAARVLTTGCNPLGSGRVERSLLDLATGLPKFAWTPPPAGRGPRRWLHVIERALPYGGHTAMARRWIESDSEVHTHSVALPAQTVPPPETLVFAARRSGGEVFVPDDSASVFTRAAWLREIACRKADCVVLHVGSHAVIPSLAFGVDGGPPVLMVNHAAHTFWTGGAIVDLVLNCRGSDLERKWTEQYRDIPRCATLPIPLPVPPEDSTDQVFSAEFRAEVRRTLGIPDDAVVLLSVGEDFKYTPMLGLDFLETARTLLSSSPNVYLVIVGLPETGRWAPVSRALNGRLKPVGRQSNIRFYHAAADVYLEGFPFGSTTALLEAGICGIPAVLAPQQCPPPFGTDGVATDDTLERPASVEAYIDRVRALIADPAERHNCGRRLARSVRENHAVPGWSKYLADVIARTPAVHRVHPIPAPQSPPEELEHYWATFRKILEGDPLIYPYDFAVRSGLNPAIDAPLQKASEAAHDIRGHTVLAKPVLAFFRLVFPWSPAWLRIRIYDATVHLLKLAGKLRRSCRGALAHLVPARNEVLCRYNRKGSTP